MSHASGCGCMLCELIDADGAYIFGFSNTFLLKVSATSKTRTLTLLTCEA
jgi:hypothetical protein